MMRTHNMTDISDRVERLKQDFLNPATPNEKKAKIIEYFKEYNELFVSDIDIDANKLATVRYDFSVKIEGWMPLPSRIVPTVLGQVTELAELDTREFFEAIKSNVRG